jgi:hypothetical protein
VRRTASSAAIAAGILPTFGADADIDIDGDAAAMAGRAAAVERADA